MQAGELKHKITILLNASDGTAPDDWKPFCTARAKKKALKNRFFYEAAAAQSENDMVFTIRYRTGITPTMQIDDGTGNTYQIIGEPIDPDDSRHWLEIHARRITTNGS